MRQRKRSRIMPGCPAWETVYIEVSLPGWTKVQRRNLESLIHSQSLLDASTKGGLYGASIVYQCQEAGLSIILYTHKKNFHKTLVIKRGNCAELCRRPLTSSILSREATWPRFVFQKGLAFILWMLSPNKMTYAVLDYLS